jgi:hypothetical protein
MFTLLFFSQAKASTASKLLAKKLCDAYLIDGSTGYYDPGFKRNYAVNRDLDAMKRKASVSVVLKKQQTENETDNETDTQIAAVATSSPLTDSSNNWELYYKPSESKNVLGLIGDKVDKALLLSEEGNVTINMFDELDTVIFSMLTSR